MTARLARNSSSSWADTASLAAKKESWAALKRSHRASSSAREARPAWRQRSMSRLKAPALGPQSVLVASASASADERLLGGLGLGLAALELGEVHAARLVEAVAGRGEPLPQRGLDVALEPDAAPLVLLPLVEQRAHPRSAGLPLDLALRLGGDRLGLGDDPLALGGRGGAGSVALGGLGLLARRRGGVDLGQLGLERGQVADDVRLGAVLAQLGQRLGRVLARQVRRRDPLVQQVGGGVELVVLAREVVQRLLGGGTRVGADLALAVGRAHEHGAVLGHAAEGLGGRSGRRRRGGRGLGVGDLADRRRGGPGDRRWAWVRSSAQSRSGLLLGHSNRKDADGCVRGPVAGATARACCGDLLDNIHSTGHRAEDGVAATVRGQGRSPCRR